MKLSHDKNIVSPDNDKMNTVLMEWRLTSSKSRLSFFVGLDQFVKITIDALVKGKRKQGLKFQTYAFYHKTPSFVFMLFYMATVL